MDFPILRILAVLVIVIYLLHLLVTFLARPRRASRRRVPDYLLSACLGDHRQAARLADYEKKRAPGISDDEARLRAVDRIERDNRV